MSPTPGRTSLPPKRHVFGADGSLRDELFGDAFASSGNPFAESRLVFLEGNRLPERFRGLAAGGASSFSVREIGFGTGANFALCAELFFRLCPGGTLEYEGLEGYPLSPGELRDRARDLRVASTRSADAARARPCHARQSRW